MEKYKLKDFARWARKEGLSDDDLNVTLVEMSHGLLGDRIGADLYKKRIGIPGRGKRGGARTIVIFRDSELAVFLHGYAKNEKSDLEPREQEGLRIFTNAFLKLSKAERKQKQKEGALIALEDKTS